MAGEPAIPGPPEPAIPEKLPVLPIRKTVIFPLAVAPLLVGQERSVRLVDDAMRKDRMVALVTQRDEAKENPGPGDLYTVGTAAVIHQLLRAPDGNLRLIVQGVERVRIGAFDAAEPYLLASVERLPDVVTPSVETPGLARAVLDLYQRLVTLSEELPDELVAASESVTDPRQVAYLVASTMTLGAAARQELLELDPLDAKLRRLVEILQQEVSKREIARKITGDVEARFSKAQRESYLQEQMNAIRRELGETENTELVDLRRRIEAALLPAEAFKEAERELKRLQDIPTASPEHGLIRTWLDWMASLPWSKLGTGDIDLERARKVLDDDHYDLERVKERLLEYLAVRKLRKARATPAVTAAAPAPAPTPPETARAGAESPPAQAEATAAGGERPAPGEDLPPAPPLPKPAEPLTREPILCFVGPPGVGKTSLGVSIARALGREFVRISLGGVHDEAEIRGHRRTYIGAMPGRIVQAIKRAGMRDPVFMLDEIDKVGSDWRGDPSSALLEVLDPAQNNAFVDNYLGIAFDLSQVLFVATANTLETIPPPLRDRMEILSLSGYTEDEKLHIAEKYLLPRQIAANGLRTEELEVDPDALRKVIRGYTREAGVRSLERAIATLCRKVARDVAEGKTPKVRIGEAQVEELLGRPHFFDEVAERTDRPGVATGLAWTPAGGDVLFIEASMMPSREEKLILTGMLGDVMRESAQAALTYVRASATRLGIDPMLFVDKSVHVHVPAGAIPKDGPSAGVTMLTAIASLATGRPVRHDVAMTGEITLRGKVLPIGGVKEKVLAAHRAGIKTVLLPKRNERDLEDVPEELREKLEFVFFEAADDLLAYALAPAPGAAAAVPRTGDAGSSHGDTIAARS